MFVSVPHGEITPPSSEGHVYEGVIDNGRWVDSANLKPGYKLLGEDESWSEVMSVEITNAPLVAYNITVDDWHTYFVRADTTQGVDAVWVHNKCFSADELGRDFAELPDLNVLPDGRQVREFTDSDGISRRLYEGEDGRFYDLDVDAPDNPNLTGIRKKINPDDDADTIRGHRRENDSADWLAADGRMVEQLPEQPKVNNRRPSGNDYIIDGVEFDNIAPRTDRLRNAWDRAVEKVAEGKPNVVLNMADSPLSLKDMIQQFDDWPIPGLERLIIVDKTGRVIDVIGG